MKSKSSLSLKICCLVLLTASACSILNLGTRIMTPTPRSLDDIKKDAFATITSQFMTNIVDITKIRPIFTSQPFRQLTASETPLSNLTKMKTTSTVTSTNSETALETGSQTTIPGTITEPSPILTEGTPSWQDTFDAGNFWYQLNTSNTFFEIKEGKLQMHAINGSEYEEWGIASIPPIKNFYLEAIFHTGIKCEKRDRYGILFRAPEPNKGYVYGFSCDGEFRIYQWDGLNFISLQDWTFSKAINSGREQKNVLGVLAIDQNISLYANGQLLTTLVDKAYTSGKLGLFIGAGKNGIFEVDVEKVTYWLK